MNKFFSISHTQLTVTIALYLKKNHNTSSKLILLFKKKINLSIKKIYISKIKYLFIINAYDVRISIK